MKQTSSSKIGGSQATPSMLLIFRDGLNKPPLYVPNGGDEETDSALSAWLEEKLVGRQKRAAA